jgi:hypothetical protein
MERVREDSMFWNRKQWALGVSYRGNDPQLDEALVAIAAQHGGAQRRVGAEQPYRGLGFEFGNRVEAEAARSEILALRPGVVATTNPQPRN